MGILYHQFFEFPLVESLIRAVPLSAGIVFVYYVRSEGSIRLYRILSIAGGAAIGFFVGAGLIVNLNLSPTLNMILLWLMIALFAVVVDKLMERRNYQPFM